MTQQIETRTGRLAHGPRGPWYSPLDVDPRTGRHPTVLTVGGRVDDPAGVAVIAAEMEHYGRPWWVRSARWVERQR